MFEPSKPSLEFLARFTMALDMPAWPLGKTSDLGERRIIPICGGSFEGPGFSGKVLEHGADWQVVTPDGLALIDSRCLLQTEEGELLYLTTRGYRHGPAEVMAEVAKGAAVDPGRYYFRLSLAFETSAPRHARLKRSVGVATAMRLGNAVVYDAYLLG
ncbi:DUF3237 domain-containing protein [Azotobacter beijerinckii]|uniref:DUF3237 domain-containing protein n=1 Tax=Azotobacter beijerinckii TaxID=170623 RepID=UPI002953259C|nr:DUF3237 domain-containing protein [Azotobacter beijerinckii]MDV7212895.1 DUF3237 domain-containing protein [Azotobacter beijerinckii]